MLDLGCIKRLMQEVLFMAKVLITPLGTGSMEKDISKREYRKAKYKFENHKEIYETILSQQPW